MIINRLLNSAYNMRFIRQYKRMKQLIPATKIDSFRYYCLDAKYDLELEIQGKSLSKYIKSLQKEFQLLSENNNVSSNRWRELKPVMEILETRKTIIENIANLKEFFEEKDEELKKLAEDEKGQLESKLKELDENLLMALIPSENDLSFNSLILEVQAGVGGQEAMLFAKEIFDMYCNFCNLRGELHLLY